MNLMTQDKAQSGLAKKFKKVAETPAGFDFFSAIHDFIGYIESNPALLNRLSSRVKANRDSKIPDKYGYLKQIYQGLEDAGAKSGVDLGHNRYAVIMELNKIRNKDISESNSFWKKRELFRKLATEIYEKLNPGQP